MNLAWLRTSRAGWVRSEKWAKRKHTEHVKANNVAGIKKWGDRLRYCRKMIAKRDREIKAKTPKRSTRQKALAEFAKYIGVTERPASSNGNPANISRWQARWGFGRVPYCGIGCCEMLSRAGVKGLSSRLAAVALIEQDAKARRGPFRGWTTDRGKVLPADLVVIGGYGVHVEMVEKVLGGGRVQTIGANTSPGRAGSQSNGGGIWRRIRTPGEIRGFALIDFPNA